MIKTEARKYFLISGEGVDEYINVSSEIQLEGLGNMSEYTTNQTLKNALIIDFGNLSA